MRFSASAPGPPVRLQLGKDQAVCPHQRSFLTHGNHLVTLLETKWLPLTMLASPPRRPIMQARISGIARPARGIGRGVRRNPRDAAFRAIADPTRREILGILRGGRQTVGEIAGNFRMSRPAVSKHLRLLRS